MRPTGFVPLGEPDDDKRVEFQRLCDSVMSSVSRNEIIVAEVIATVSAGRSPVVLTERTEHLEILANALRPHIQHVITLQGGMGRKPLTAALKQLRDIPQNEPRVIAPSVQRLIRDGVDQPLATLFVHATRPTLGDSTDRARSASESFLFRRLETLPALVGKFRLNTKLPISFDGFSEMEIDLLSAEHRIVIEIDGSQHFIPSIHKHR